ncbi:hypothetical protein QAD02_000119 [Eretmocerus hayati]|uniref:Uncharacterized protein n=1 Tax=Eretmocerus hayati TaxID=131215 RepID=A0ACC2NCH7_9HYME|nr:hypothetical protein QAD02_000119 [Eretmocerus hayati]
MMYQKGALVVRIKQTAAETFCLFRYLPLMIADLVKEKNEHWDYLIWMRQVFDILMAPRFVESDALGLEYMVEHFLDLLIKLYNETIPKLHHLVHYMRMMLDNGPS